MSPTSRDCLSSELLLLLFRISEDSDSGSFSEKENVLPSNEQSLFSKTIDNEAVEHKKKVTGNTVFEQRQTLHIPMEEWINEVLLRPRDENTLFLLICCAQNNQLGAAHLIDEMSPQEIYDAISYINKENNKMINTDIEIDKNIIYDALSSLSEEKKESILKFLNKKIDYFTCFAEWVRSEITKATQISHKLNSLFQKTSLAWEQKITKQGYYNTQKICPSQVKSPPKITYKPTPQNPHFLTRK